MTLQLTASTKTTAIPVLRTKSWETWPTGDTTAALSTKHGKTCQNQGRSAALRTIEGKTWQNPKCKDLMSTIHARRCQSRDIIDSKENVAKMLTERD